MADEKSPLGNIGRVLLRRVFGGEIQAKRRATKTWWDVVFIPVNFALIGLVTFGFFELFWWIHVLVHPEDAHRQHAWLQGSMTLAQFLMIIVPFFGAVPVAFIANNGLMWLVPWARRAADKKTRSGQGPSFAASQAGLWKMARVTVPITLVCGLIGAILKG